MTAVDSPWLLLAEAQEYARISRTEILTALNSGELRGFQRKANAMWRIHRDDLDAWLRGEPPAAIDPRFSRRTA